MQGVSLCVSARETKGPFRHNATMAQLRSETCYFQWLVWPHNGFLLRWAQQSVQPRQVERWAQQRYESGEHSSNHFVSENALKGRFSTLAKDTKGPFKHLDKTWEIVGIWWPGMWHKQNYMQAFESPQVDAGPEMELISYEQQQQQLQLWGEQSAADWAELPCCQASVGCSEERMLCGSLPELAETVHSVLWI